MTALQVGGTDENSALQNQNAIFAYFEIDNSRQSQPEQCSPLI